MTTTDNSRADALTGDKRQALGEALTEYFAELDRNIGIDTPDRILSLIDYHNDRFIDDLIDRAIVPAIFASPVEQHEAAPAGAAMLDWAVRRWDAEVKNRPLTNVHRRSLDDTWRQVVRHCGGDDVSLLGPRHDDLLAASAPAPSAPLEGTGNGADNEYQVSIDVRDLFAYLRAAWREGQHYDREDTPDQADSWSAASDYANKTIDRWTSMRPIVSRAPRTEVAGAMREGWKLVPIKPTGVMKDAGHWALPVGVGGPWTAAAVYQAMLDQVTTPPSADAAAAAAPADGRAAFDYDDVVSICDAHGICLPVDCVEMVVDIVKLSGLLPAGAAASQPR
ncbi:hypothetical protein [Burkholderia sp. BCC0322]|uniref:hypothetical protein n=1 Tax=unclassified Burkholderia TaxID=2613784 RepID=UPI00158D7D28|nr:hypothetical protein [Burkholderia sp. BCC0322]